MFVDGSDCHGASSPTAEVYRSAHPLTLNLLTHNEARELLARRLGPERVAAPPRAVQPYRPHHLSLRQWSYPAVAVVTRCRRQPLSPIQRES